MHNITKNVFFLIRDKETIIKRKSHWRRKAPLIPYRMHNATFIKILSILLSTKCFGRDGSKRKHYRIDMLNWFYSKSNSSSVTFVFSISSFIDKKCIYLYRKPRNRISHIKWMKSLTSWYTYTHTHMCKILGYAKEKTFVKIEAISFVAQHMYCTIWRTTTTKKYRRKGKVLRLLKKNEIREIKFMYVYLSWLHTLGTWL